jgi:hypothetical protein
MKKIIVVILMVSILFVYPTNAGNSDFFESGGIEPTGGL